MTKSLRRTSPWLATADAQPTGNSVLGFFQARSWTWKRLIRSRKESTKRQVRSPSQWSWKTNSRGWRWRRIRASLMNITTYFNKIRYYSTRVLKCRLPPMWGYLLVSLIQGGGCCSLTTSMCQYSIWARKSGLRSTSSSNKMCVRFLETGKLRTGQARLWMMQRRISTLEFWLGIISSISLSLRTLVGSISQKRKP